MQIKINNRVPLNFSDKNIEIAVRNTIVYEEIYDIVLSRSILIGKTSVFNFRLLLYESREDTWCGLVPI